MSFSEKSFEEISLKFLHYSYYQKALQAKGFKLVFLMFSDETGVIMRYSKYSKKLEKSLNVEINNEIIIVSSFRGTEHKRLDFTDFYKTFGGETLKKAWNNMCGDEEILKKFSEFESL